MEPNKQSNPANGGAGNTPRPNAGRPQQPARPAVGPAGQVRSQVSQGAQGPQRPSRPQAPGQGQAPRQGQGPRPMQAQAGKPQQPGGQKPAGRSGGRGGGGNRRRGGQQIPNHTDLMPALDSVPVNKSVFNGTGGAQQTKARPPKGAGGAEGQKPGPEGQLAAGGGVAAGGERRANFTAREPKLRVILLGGVGEIGKSMMALEFENDIIIIDMGFAFPNPETQPGIDYIIPDVTYLEKNRHKVRGIVITHGHMDHIGGSGYMIPKFPVPIYGSRLTLAFVEKQISEFKIQQPKWMVMDPDKHERVQIGAFNVELVRVTHTISDSTAVVVRTPAGTVINTGDWRPDPDPLDGKLMDFPRLAEISQEGVALLMSDSTSCDRVGHTPGERVVEPTIHDLFGRAEGRIIISSFSSSITRVQLIIDAAAKAGRKLALVGRSTLANVEVCVKLGYLKIPAGLIVRVQDIVNLPDNKVVVLCTGSQGEQNSALVRMSTGDHQNIKIKGGDSVILSSSVIPGNEVAVVTLTDDLMREGAIVYSRATEMLKGHGPVHVGGHALRDDVGDLVKLLKPKYYLPIHGEFHHLVYSAEVAVENGVPRENVFVMDNGDTFELTPSRGVKGARVPSGVVLVDGAGVGDVEGVVLRDRIAMGQDGVFMIIATVSRKTGRLVSSPDIISRGFIYMKENEELINRARADVRKAFEKRAAGAGGGGGGAGGSAGGGGAVGGSGGGGAVGREDWAKFKLKLRDEIGDLLYSKTKRSPMVLPVINEV